MDEVMVNREFVRKVGASIPDEVLGQIVAANAGNIKGSIVGVIDDFHNQDFHENIEPVLIFPETRFYREMAIKINLSQTQTALQHIEKEWSARFPDYIFEYDFLDDRVAELYESEQRFFSLIGIFSGLAVFIGCLGVYGLILFFVVQKTKEIGIRKVLGGDIRHILVFVGKDFFKLIAITGVIAVPVAWYFMNQWLQDFQYRTDISWWIFAMAIGLVMGVTLLSVSYQAVKAAQLNPVKSLRVE